MYLSTVGLLQQRHVQHTTPIALPTAAVRTSPNILYICMYIYNLLSSANSSPLNSLSSCSQFITKLKHLPPILHNIWGQAPTGVLWESVSQPLLISYHFDVTLACSNTVVKVDHHFFLTQNRTSTNIPSCDRA